MKKFLLVLFILIIILVILFGIIFLINFYRAKNILPEDNIKSTGEIFNPKLASLRHRLETTDDPSIGSNDAPITIVQFMDFKCPFCAQSFFTLRELSFLYPKDVRIILRDYPLTSEDSLMLALAGNCAHEQGKFWQLHDKLFQAKDDVVAGNLSQYAAQAGININQFNNCIASEKYKKEIYDDISDAQVLGAEGTPTWFVNGYKFEGVISLEQFKEIIDGVLEKL